MDAQPEVPGPTTGATLAPGLQLNDLLDLLGKQTALINNLWTVFAAAGFAAAGFSAIAGDDASRWRIAIVVGVAYSAFAFGHWRMLRTEIVLRWHLAQALRAFGTRPNPSGTMFDSATIATLMADTAASLGSARAAHLVLDACVLAAIVVRAAWPGA